MISKVGKSLITVIMSNWVGILIAYLKYPGIDFHGSIIYTGTQFYTKHQPSKLYENDGLMTSLN